MTGTSADATELAVENARLRGDLWVTARALKSYHDAKHVRVELDGEPMLQITVSALTRSKAGEATRKANERLRKP